MEVVPNIHRIEAPLGDRFMAFYALVGETATLLIDTGLDDSPRGVIEPYFREHGLDLNRIRYVLISHADLDHQGGNRAMRELVPNAIFMCHEFDRPQIEDVELMLSQRYNEWSSEHGIPVNEASDNWVRDVTKATPIDLSLTGGEKIRLGPDWLVEVLHTPGHSWGHLTVYDARSRTAIIIDAALYNTIRTSDGSNAFPPTYRYLDTYRATIQRLLSMPIDTLLTAHYPVMKGAQAREFLAESLAYTDRVDAALAEALQNAPAPMTISELSAALKKVVGDWPDGAEAFLCYPFTGHLEQMVSYGKVTTSRRDGIVVYAWA